MPASWQQPRHFFYKIIQINLMKQKLLCLLAVISFSVAANAKIWRVNNVGYGANFTSLQQANDNPNVGANSLVPDTIHLEGSNTVYDGANITKRLVIIGAGYFLPENSNVSFNNMETKISNIYFNTGSAGSQVLGVWFYQLSTSISVEASNITIRRCKIDYGIYLAPGLTDIKIIQNFFTSYTSSSAISVLSTGFPSDVLINNNIFRKPLTIGFYNSSYTVSECKNNVFAYTGSGVGIQLYAGVFQNNILINPNITVNINGGNFNNVSYNVSAFVSGQFGTANNNIIVNDFNNWFVTPITANSVDKDFQLQAGTTPGSDGTDRGAFGGAAITNRYALSGLAPIPVVYQITTSGVATPAGALPVTIKARTIQ
jgi:hypothetical protein